jgi:hypothetical protein
LGHGVNLMVVSLLAGTLALGTVALCLIVILKTRH